MMPTRTVLRRRHAAALLLLLPSRNAATDRCIPLTTRHSSGSPLRRSFRNITAPASAGVDGGLNRSSSSSSPAGSDDRASSSAVGGGGTPGPAAKTKHHRRRLATAPYTWEDLIDIIHRRRDLSLLVRSAEQERVYQRYREGLARRWRSVYDHILHSKFRFERRDYVVGKSGEEGDEEEGGGETPTDSSSMSSTSPPASDDSDFSGDDLDDDDDDADAPPPGVLWEAHPPLSQFTGTRLTLCLNDFPYYMGPNIEHWCLWKIGGNVTAREIEHAKEELRSMTDEERGDVVDVLHFVNPLHLKSLPDIDHAHILCLRRGGGSAAADECDRSSER